METVGLSWVRKEPIFVFHLPIKNKCIDNKSNVNSSLKKFFEHNKVKNQSIKTKVNNKSLKIKYKN